MRVTQVSTRAVQTTTYHFVSINSIPSTTILGILTTYKMYTIVLQDDFIEDITAIRRDDTKSIMARISDLNGVKS